MAETPAQMSYSSYRPDSPSSAAVDAPNAPSVPPAPKRDPRGIPEDDGAPDTIGLTRRNTILAPSISITDKIDRIADDFELCRNRLWEIARSVDVDDRETLLSVFDGVEAGTSATGRHKGHDQCTFDFCEHSRLDFTSVAQRHEGCGKNELSTEVSQEKLLQENRVIDYIPVGRTGEKKACTIKTFDSKLLEKALSEYESTAWSVEDNLDVPVLIQRPEHYMAVSHVWADGSGSGAWPPGQVNECLFKYFANIALDFQCEGLWWDTICIPRDKAARSKAILRMQRNYEEARITLVHDCFLREWEYLEERPDLACLAIAISPWFSRGWTALELANSRKVKVVFKDNVIKDLDEDILRKPGDAVPARHEIASKIIEALREKRVYDLDRLLEILRARHTSWPRDVAIIAGQLVGVPVKGTSTQQEIYQKVLVGIQKLRHDHLFHNSVPMSKRGFSWCPASIFDIPISSGRYEGRMAVYRNGDILGAWTGYKMTDPVFRKANYNWNHTHPLVEARLKQCLMEVRNSGSEYWLLAVPEAELSRIERGLLVKPLSDRPRQYQRAQYLGVLHFNQPEPCIQEISPGSKLRLFPDGMKHVVIAGVLSGRPPMKNGGKQRPDDAEAEAVELLSACADGDYEMIKNMLKSGYDPYVTDQDGNTALHVAAQQRHHATIVVLLSSWTKTVDGFNNEGLTALHLAAREGDRFVMRELINSRLRANPAVLDAAGWPPLYHAIWNGHWRAVECLLVEGENIDAEQQDRFGQTPLHLAAERGNLRIVELLLEKIFTKDPHAKFALCDKLQTVLHRAALGGSIAIVSRMLDCPEMRDMISQLDKNEKSPVHIAAEKGHAGVVRILLQRYGETVTGGQVTELDDWRGRTPLILAIRNGHCATVQVLLDEGNAGIEGMGSTGRTPLMWAAEAGRVEIVKLLLKRGARPISVDADSRTPLLWGAESGKLEIAEILIDYGGVDIELAGTDNMTPLLWASERGHAGIVKLLIDRGADLKKTKKAPPFRGNGPLLLSARNGHADVVKFLLEAGVDVNSLHPVDGSALEVAVSQEHLAVVKLLLEKGAHTDTGANAKDPSRGRREALAIAVACGNEDLVRILLEAGADPNGGYTVSYTGEMAHLPIFLAQMSRSSIVDILLENGASLPPWSPGVSDVFFKAAITGQEATLRLLFEKLDSAQPKHELDQDELHKWLVAAAVEDEEGTTRLLLDKGADPTHKSEKTGEIFAEAFQREAHSAIQVLLESGAVPPDPGLGGGMLKWAVEEGHYRVAKLLLDDGVRVESDKTGANLVRHAALKGNARMLALLLESKRAEMPKDGSAALLWGQNLVEEVFLSLFYLGEIEYGSPGRTGKAYPYMGRILGSRESKFAISVVETLLDNGASGPKYPNNGYMAVWAARESPYGRILAHRIIRDYLDDFNPGSIPPEEFVHPRTETFPHLIEAGVPSLVERALMYHEDPVVLFSSSRYYEGRDLLFRALGQVELLKVLLEWGADPTYISPAGKTALSVATAQGYKASVKVLMEVTRDKDALQKYRLLGIDHPDGKGRQLPEFS